MNARIKPAHEVMLSCGDGFERKCRGRFPRGDKVLRSKICRRSSIFGLQKRPWA